MSIAPATDSLMDSVNNDVGEIFRNQRRIEGEARNLQAQTQRFTAQTGQWLETIDNFNASLKVARAPQQPHLALRGQNRRPQLPQRA